MVLEAKEGSLKEGTGEGPRPYADFGRCIISRPQASHFPGGLNIVIRRVPTHCPLGGSPEGSRNG